MKIICTYKDDVSTNGLSVTLSSIYGDDFKFWDTIKKPVFDVFDELNPDILIVHHEYLNDFLVDVLNEYHNTKVVVISDGGHSKFRSVSPNADLANLIQFANGAKLEYFEADIVYWSRNKNITEELLIILHFISNRYVLKIFGPVRIDMPQYIGAFTNSETADILASAKINLDFHNHSRFDAIVNNTLSIYYEEDGHPWIKNLEDIPKYLKQDNLYKANVKKIRKIVRSSETFYHYVSDMFVLLDLTEEVDKTLQKLETIL